MHKRIHDNQYINEWVNELDLWHSDRRNSPLEMANSIPNLTILFSYILLLGFLRLLHNRNNTTSAFPYLRSVFGFFKKSQRFGFFTSPMITANCVLFTIFFRFLITGIYFCFLNINATKFYNVYFDNNVLKIVIYAMDTLLSKLIVVNEVNKTKLSL